MMNEQHEKRVADFLTTFHASELDLVRIASFLAPNATYQPIVPLARPVVGREAVCAELDRQYRLYADCQCETIAVASNGRQVFTERVDTVRQLADGSQTVVHLTGVFELDDSGLITSWREYWDALEVAQQLGVTMEQMARIMNTEAALEGAA